MRSLDRLSVASGPPPPGDAGLDTVEPVDLGAELAADAMGPADGMTDRAPATQRVFFVVGSVSLTAADGAIQKRLSDRGLDVILVNDDEVAFADTSIGGLILISKTARSAAVGARFRVTAQPVFLWDPLLYDEMGMVDALDGSRGVTPGVRNLRIDASTSSLAAGLRGTPVVTNNPSDVGWGVPSAGAILVASLPGQPTQAGIFAYDTGSRMSALTAPARRVGFFLSDNSASDLTADGWALFDAAITWALAAP